MVTNYFKSNSGLIYFFVDTIPESIESAWAAVQLFDRAPAVWRPVGTPGEWDKCQVIGHRTYEDIQQDLSIVTKREDRLDLEYELASLQSCYAKAGRTAQVSV